MIDKPLWLHSYHWWKAECILSLNPDIGSLRCRCFRCWAALAEALTTMKTNNTMVIVEGDEDFCTYLNRWSWIKNKGIKPVFFSALLVGLQPQQQLDQQVWHRSTTATPLKRYWRERCYTCKATITLVMLAPTSSEESHSSDLWETKQKKTVLDRFSSFFKFYSLKECACVECV